MRHDQLGCSHWCLWSVIICRMPRELLLGIMYRNIGLLTCGCSAQLRQLLSTCSLCLMTSIFRVSCSTKRNKLLASFLPLGRALFPGLRLFFFFIHVIDWLKPQTRHTFSRLASPRRIIPAGTGCTFHIHL